MIALHAHVEMLYEVLKEKGEEKPLLSSMIFPSYAGYINIYEKKIYRYPQREY